jgi:hypothetical protein
MFIPLCTGRNSMGTGCFTQSQAREESFVSLGVWLVLQKIGLT